MEEIRQKVEVHGNREDIILAHTCPYDHRPVECFFPGLDESKVDNSMERFVQEIVDRAEYNALYCGHWHTEKQDGKIRFLFHDVIVLEEKP
jgi:3-oxoacid CoA-transferase subunit A